jgi:hypothetical protein
MLLSYVLCLLYVCVFVLFLLLATWLLTQHFNKEELNFSFSLSSFSIVSYFTDLFLCFLILFREFFAVMLIIKMMFTLFN